MLHRRAQLPRGVRAGVTPSARNGRRWRGWCLRGRLTRAGAQVMTLQEEVAQEIRASVGGGVSERRGVRHEQGQECCRGAAALRRGAGGPRC